MKRNADIVRCASTRRGKVVDAAASASVLSFRACKAARQGRRVVLATASVAVLGLTLIAPSPLRATEWTGSTSNNWFTPSNWSTNRVPTGASDTIIQSSTIRQPVISAPGAQTSGLVIGNTNSGRLTIRNGGTLGSRDVFVQSGSAVTVEGVGSSWNSDFLLVGRTGSRSTLTIKDGGTVSSQNGTIGAGAVTVDGAGSSWTSPSSLTVTSGGELTIRNGGTVNGGDSVTVANLLNIGAASGQPAAAPGTLNTSSLNLGGGSFLGTLVFNHTSSDYIFEPTMSGGGSVVVEAGTTVLKGNNTYTGETTVGAGVLIVDGSIAHSSGLTVAGVVGGTGRLPSTALNGQLSPGDSIGTIKVDGNLIFGPGSSYLVEVSPTAADRTNVTGKATLKGTVLAIFGSDDSFKKRYTILRADGGLGGTEFSGVFASNLPSHFVAGLSYDQTRAFLDLTAKLGQSSQLSLNARNVAMASDDYFNSGGVLPPNLLSLYSLSDNVLADVLPLHTGELHATVAGTLVNDSRYVRDAVLGRLMQASHAGQALAAAGPQVASSDSQAMMLGAGASLYDGKSLIEPSPSPLAFWTQAFGAWGDFETDGNAASVDRDVGGFVSGMDASIGGSWRVGLATGAMFSNVTVDDRISSAEIESYHLGAYAGGMAGAFALRGGGMWAWNEIDTSRAVVFPGFYERQQTSYDADTGQLFGEVAYPTQMGGIALEPFGGLAFVFVNSDNFHERGGPLTALRGETDHDVGYATLGLRAAHQMQWGEMSVTPHLSAAWQHAFDEVTPEAALVFAGPGIGFTVYGVPLAEDSALVEAGLDFAFGERLTAGVSYTGQYAERFSDNGVKGRFTWLF